MKPKDKQGVQPEDELKPTSAQEEEIWKVLEQSRQNVKQLAKRELEGEVITEEILNRPLRKLR